MPSNHSHQSLFPIRNSIQEFTPNHYLGQNDFKDVNVVILILLELVTHLWRPLKNHFLFFLSLFLGHFCYRHYNNTLFYTEWSRRFRRSISSSIFNLSKEKSVAYTIIVLEKSLGEILLSSTKLLWFHEQNFLLGLFQMFGHSDCLIS